MLGSCKAPADDAPKPSAASTKTDWRKTGPFAAKRAALKKAVETFPSDAAAVPRCAPNRQGVLVLSYNTARTLYAPSAAQAPDVGGGVGLDVGARRTFLEAIERAEWESAPPEDPRWRKPPFEAVSAVALYRPTSSKAPEVGACNAGPAGKTCQLTAGVVEGDLVVFDDAAKPLCANKLRIEGPASALFRASEKLEDYQRTGVQQILDGFFWYAGEVMPKDAPWRFLSLGSSGTSPPQRYTVIVDGAVVQTGKGE